MGELVLNLLHKKIIIKNMTYSILKEKIFLVVLICSTILVSSCRKVDRLKSDVNFPAAYVINGKSNSISVINLETNEVVESAQFKKGTWPHHIYPNSTKDKFVVSLTGMDLSGGHGGHDMAGNSYLLILEAKDLSVVAFEKTEEMAHNAMFINDGEEIWMPQMKTSGEIKILDGKTPKEEASIQVGSGPLEMTINSGGNYIFVANGEDNTISVIDIATKTVVKTINVGNEPVGAWPGSNNKMYVDREISKQIFEIDAVTLEITDTIQLTFTPAYVNLNALTGELWVSDAEFGSVHTYEIISNQWVENGNLVTGSNAHAIGFNSTGNKAYITNQNAATVSVIDAVTLTKIIDIAVGEKPNGILIIE
jgi:YVTN family beta-propeller protein